MRVTVRTLAALGFALALPTGAQSVVTDGTTMKDAADHNPPPQIFVGGSCPIGSTTLCVPLDGTFIVPTMDSPSGSGQATPSDPCQRNDDDSALAVPLGFSFDFYGTSYTEVYINNNGNVSFDSAFSTFTASGFPVSGFPMIAPFWGDVDTGNVGTDPTTGGGVVRYKSLSTGNGDAVNRFVVTWDHVGYYNEQADLQNTFQVILTDGLDPLIGIGNNVCFCYDDMQWTTGSASGGSGGFGGTPATVGANKGDGSTFFQVGRFDHEGVDYDGPDGNADGVSFLDDSTICFATFGDTNVPPVAIGFPDGNRYDTYVGVPFNFSVDFIGPEGGQTVSVVVDDGGLANFSSVATPGNPANVSGTFTPDGSQDGGSFVVTLTATDDGGPPLTTSVDLIFNVLCAEAANVVRPGSDNAQTYSSSTPPVIGGLWTGTVDPGCSLVFWAVAPEFLGGCLDPGVDAGAFATGDFLINPAAIWTPIFVAVNPFTPDPASGITTISFPVPDLLYHCGETWCTQCLCVEADGSFTLTNAIDVVLGL